MREQLAAREAKDIIHETTVSEINIAGLPGVTVPAGAYATGSPFNLIAIGRNGAKRTARHRNLLTNKRRATEKHRLSCAHDLSPEDAHRIDGGHDSTVGPKLASGCLDGAFGSREQGGPSSLKQISQVIVEEAA
jgi:hypothetical protein